MPDPKKEKKVLYTNDPNDPRLQSYQDSLSLFEYNKLQRAIENPSLTKGSQQYKEVNDKLFRVADSIASTSPNISFGEYSDDYVSWQKTIDYRKKQGYIDQSMTVEDYMRGRYKRGNSSDIHSKSIAPSGKWKGFAINEDYSNVEPSQPIKYRPTPKVAITEPPIELKKPYIPNYDTDLQAYLKKEGKSHKYSDRKKMAIEYGIDNYSGTADQNIQLLKLIKEGVSPEEFKTQEETAVQKNELVNVTKKLESTQELIKEEETQVSIPENTETPNTQETQRNDQVQYRKVLTGYKINPRTGKREPVYEEQGYRARGTNTGKHTTTQNKFEDGGEKETNPWMPLPETPTPVITKKQAKENEEKSSKKRKPYRLKDGDNLKYVKVTSKTGNHNVLAKTDVDITNLTPEMQNMVGELYMDLGISEEDPGFDLVITAGQDGKHADGSPHYKGKAIDVRISKNYHGPKGSENNAYKSPAYLYFTEGKGKDIIAKYGVTTIDPYHGTAPHLDLAQRSTTNQKNQPVDQPTDRPVINRNILPESNVDFIYEANNVINKPTEDTTEKETNMKKSKLYKEQQKKNFLEAVGNLNWQVEESPLDSNYQPPELLQNQTIGKEHRALGGLSSISQIPEEFLTL